MMKDLTFVIQGPVDILNIYKSSAVKSIKKYFPDSKIIISTWGQTAQCVTNEHISIVTNIDPGAPHVRGDKWAINFRRQGVSTLGGLAHCKTIYACKIRSDCYFVTNSLRKFFVDYLRSGKKFLFTDKLFRFPYFNYASDWFQIGRTSDLIELWQESLRIEQQLEYFNVFKYSFYDKEVNFYARYHPEQIVYQALHPDESIIDRDFRPSVIDYMLYRYNFNKSYFTVGKINIDLKCVKYPNKINDYKISLGKYDRISLFFAVLDLIIGVISWFHYTCRGQLRKKMSKILNI